MSTIITVATRKGGVHKTTTTFNTGYSIASVVKKSKVLLIDNDPQGDLTVSCLGTKSNLSAHVADLYHEKIPQPIYIRDNLAIIGSNNELTFVQDKGFEIIYNLGASLDAYKKDFDYIFIDNLTHEGYLFTAGLLAANYLLSPIILEPYAGQGLEQTLEIVQKIKKPKLNPDLKILGILLSGVLGRISGVHSAVYEEIKQTYGDLVFETKIGKGVVAVESPSYLKPVIEYSPKHKIAANYINLSKEIIKRLKG